MGGVTILPCGHSFCTKCIQVWVLNGSGSYISRGQLFNTCPTCRTLVGMPVVVLDADREHKQHQHARVSVLGDGHDRDRVRGNTNGFRHWTLSGMRWVCIGMALLNPIIFLKVSLVTGATLLPTGAMLVLFVPGYGVIR